MKNWTMGNCGVGMCFWLKKLKPITILFFSPIYPLILLYLSKQFAEFLCCETCAIVLIDWSCLLNKKRHSMKKEPLSQNWLPTMVFTPWLLWFSSSCCWLPTLIFIHWLLFINQRLWIVNNKRNVTFGGILRTIFSVLLERRNLCPVLSFLCF